MSVVVLKDDQNAIKLTCWGREMEVKAIFDVRYNNAHRQIAHTHSLIRTNPKPFQDPKLAFHKFAQIRKTEFHKLWWTLPIMTLINATFVKMESTFST